MQPLNIFNPADWMDRFVEEFASCPSVIALTTYCGNRKPSKVHCTTRAFVRVDLFVPQQKLYGLLHCHQLNNARYAAIQVTKSQNSDEKYWLVVDSITRYGYLLPIDAFTEAESEILLSKTHEFFTVV